MALQTSGPISFNDIHIEAGGTTSTTVSLNDTDVRALIGSTSGSSVSLSDYYGASAGYSNGNSFHLYSSNQDISYDYRHELYTGFSTHKYVIANIKLFNYGTGTSSKDAVIAFDLTDPVNTNSAVLMRTSQVQTLYYYRTSAPDANNVYVVSANEVGVSNTFSLHGFDGFTREWSKVLSGGNVYAISSDVRSSGYVYIYGRNSSNNEMFLAKVDTSDGSISWARAFDFTSTDLFKTDAVVYEYDSTRVAIQSNRVLGLFNKSDGSNSAFYTASISDSSLDDIEIGNNNNFYRHPSGARIATFEATYNKTNRYYLVMRSASGSHQFRYYTQQTSKIPKIYPLGRDSFAVVAGSYVYPRLFYINSQGVWTDRGSYGVLTYNGTSYMQPMFSEIPIFYAENDYFVSLGARESNSVTPTRFAFGEYDINANSYTSYEYNSHKMIKTSQTLSTFASNNSWYTDNPTLSHTTSTPSFTNSARTFTDSSYTSSSTTTTFTPSDEFDILQISGS